MLASAARSPPSVDGHERSSADVDFLLECIGFPPDQDFEELLALARREGESVAWRGPSGDHLRLPLGGGLELRIDRESDGGPWSLYPHYRTEERLRLSIETVRELPDSSYDAMVTGWANPPVDGDPSASPDAYALSAILTDARRLPRDLLRGHVLAVSLAGFALDVEHVAASESIVRGSQHDPRTPSRRFADGGWIQVLGGVDEPGGCVDLFLAIERSDTLTNPLTGARVTVLSARAPGRPMVLLTSPWQLDGDGLPAPEPGAWIRGTFLLTGRIAGGLQSPSDRLGRNFG